jgi:methanogenic corrinoid protein MtbC1
VFTLWPELVAKVGADATTPEARHAPALAESLLTTRVKMI